MRVVFDAEPLVAFAFDEPGGTAVEGWIDGVYDGDHIGYVTTVNLAEFRYVAARRTSVERADDHIDELLRLGLHGLDVDGLWEPASDLKATYSPSLGDAYAVAAAEELAGQTADDVTLLVGGDDDYDVFDGHEEFDHRVERFRTDAS